ncbi:MAG: Potassium-transporting ATPase A chain [uncultured Phycisphaerae bacterium]|uniref:Potassium-transporting ATPase potassium-binding subunit n=1 Tax=uncultured Phycisphaerae bacterium TaxID=904963 RepID=A0A6J4N857_9BACT|nr:MAG: Potassium-transporting ATPase A chain [uncultured Phycisphaerae bacterium]
MTAVGILQIGLLVLVLLALVKPLGTYMARVYEGKSPLGLDRVLGPVERLTYRLAGVRADAEMGWKAYAVALLLFNLLGLIAVYGVQRLQGLLPLNPQDLPAVAPDLSFNTAVSFATNTNWQSYSGEVALSYLTQMLGLTVQNFVSAATGMAVLVALIRGLARKQATAVGNFWVDLTRGTLYILLPLSFVLAVALASQGVVQTFSPHKTVALVQPYTKHDGTRVDTQTLALGPAASQIAIKQLGTNGGGFFGVNSAHPFENPTPLSNFLQCLAILLIPASLCYTFGRMVGDTRQGWAVLAAMTLVFVPLALACYAAEQAGNPALESLGVAGGGGNMEGKEARFGVASSALWATATTAASNGSVNSMHDSYTPLGGLVPMWLMQLGEVVFGGVGSGLYGMLVFAIIAVFVAGLMVGRTPEYLGKKIEAFEMKMASLVILIPPAVVLLGAAVAVSVDAGTSRVTNPGPHGFSQILYWASSTGNNNGSAFAGLGTNNALYNVAGGLLMLFSRYWLIVPVLAIAGSLASKKQVPPGSGTLPTHTPLFVALLVGTVLLVGALTFIPALALGPVVEHLIQP